VVVTEGPTTTPRGRIAVAGEPGNRLLVADLVATVVLVVLLVGAVIAPDPVGLVAAAWSLLLFVVGCGLFLWAFAIAVRRSRVDAIGIDGLFFLTGTAPSAVRRRFLVLLAVQSLASIGAAAARPFTTVAFGVLAPMFGLGIQGLWSARYGRFAPRDDAGATRSRR
jgi:hypothetical protein